jgi:hypothetical protein
VSGLRVCVGCRFFALLDRAAVVHEQACVDCVRPPAAADLQFAGIEAARDADRERAPAAY